MVWFSHLGKILSGYNSAADWAKELFKLF